MDKFEQEREKLREIQAVFENAVANNTIEDMRPYTDQDFSFVSFTDRSFKDFTAFSKQWQLTREEMVGDGSFRTQLEPDPSLFVDDIAVCLGNSKNTMVDKNGEKFEFGSNWTTVFKKTDGQWKVLRAHNSLDPFRNPMLVSAVKSKLKMTAVTSFFVGAALGSLIVYII